MGNRRRLTATRTLWCPDCTAKTKVTLHCGGLTVADLYHDETCPQWRRFGQCSTVSWVPLPELRQDNNLN